MADSINTINVGGIDKEVEDTVARTSGTSANDRCTTLESRVSNLAARVEEIIAPTGEAPSPAEILDARVGADNTIYDTLGDAIRGQISKLDSNLEAAENIDFIKLIPRYYIVTSGNIGSVVDLTPQPSASFKDGGYAIVDCVEGDLFIINGTGATAARLWCFIDSENKMILKSIGNVEADNLLLKAPNNTSKLIINSQTTGLNIKGVNSYSNIELLKNTLYSFSNYEYAPIYENAGAINTGGDTVDITTIDYPSGNSFSFFVEDCSEGDVFIISGVGGGTYRLWCFIDSDNAVISRETGGADVVNKVITAPNKAVKLVSNFISQYPHSLYKGKNTSKIISDITSETDEKIRILEQTFRETVRDDFTVIILDDTCYIPCDSSPVDITPIKRNGWQSKILSCSEGDIFTIKAVGGVAARAFCFIDSDYNILNSSSSGAQVNDEVVAPTNSAFIIINNYYGNAESLNNRYFLSYKGAIRRVSSRYSSWSGYFSKSININTSLNQIEIPAQRMIIGNRYIDIERTVVPFNGDSNYPSLYYDAINGEFKFIYSINAVPNTGYYFMGYWTKNEMESACINGSFTIDSASQQGRQYFESNVMIPGKEDVGWVGNWINPEAISLRRIRNKLYWSFTGNSGVKGIASYDFVTGEIIKKVLHKKYRNLADLHDDLAIHIFDNGTILCAYSSGHAIDKKMHIRKSITPENIENFTDDLVLSTEGGVSYAQLIESSGKLYLFYRNSALKWAYRYSTDMGDTWSDEVNLIISDAQYYCLFKKTTTDGVIRVISYTNPQAIPVDTNIRQSFFHTANDTLYDSNNVMILGTSDVNKDNISILIPNDSDLINQRLFDVAETAIEQPLILYAPYSSYSNSIYRCYDSGVIHDIVQGGDSLKSNAPYFLGAKFIDTNKVVACHGVNDDGGTDIVTLYNYDGISFTKDKDIYSEVRGNLPIRNYYPIVDINKRAILWLRGWYGNTYTDFNNDAKIYLIEEDKIV